jgi:septum formation protein
MHIILGSQSRDRQKLLRNSNIPFTVIVSDYQENEALDLPPKELVLEMAKGKAAAVVEKVKKTCPKIIGKEAIIICADTMVEYRGEIIGKAKDKQDAIRILSLLQGNIHEIHTAVVLIKYPELIQKSFVSTTKVKFAHLTKEMMELYLADQEFEGRAGAYSINERAALFIEWIEGSQTNVAGLPMAQLRSAMLEFGVDLLQFSKNSDNP